MPVKMRSASRATDRVAFLLALHAPRLVGHRRAVLLGGARSVTALRLALLALLVLAGLLTCSLLRAVACPITVPVASPHGVGDEANTAHCQSLLRVTQTWPRDRVVARGTGLQFLSFIGSETCRTPLRSDGEDKAGVDTIDEHTPATVRDADWLDAEREGRATPGRLTRRRRHEEAVADGVERMLQKAFSFCLWHTPNRAERSVEEQPQRDRCSGSRP